MARLLTRGEVLVSFLRASFSPKSYFPPVWFAEADDSHLTDDERQRQRGGSAPKLRFTPFFEAHVGVPSYGLRSGSTSVDAEGKEATLVSVQSLGCFSGSAVLDVQSAASFEITGVGAASGGAPPEICASVTALVSGVGSSAGMTSLVASGDADVYVGSYFAGSRANAADVLTIQNPTDEELIFLMRKMRRVDNSLTC